MDMRKIAERFRAAFEVDTFRQSEHISCFTYPAVPVLCAGDPGRVKLFTWGLIPGWVKDQEQADKIRKMTFNARAETIHEKPSFRGAIGKKRCIVIADGFFEWNHQEKKKYPFFIQVKDSPIFGLAGIWDAWKDPESEDTIKTFSIITVPANPLMARIHNSKKRMPVILPKESEERWLSPALKKQEIDEILQPFDENALEACSVALPSRKKGEARAAAGAAHEPYFYKELEGADLPGYFNLTEN